MYMFKVCFYLMRASWGKFYYANSLTPPLWMERHLWTYRPLLVGSRTASLTLIPAPASSSPDPAHSTNPVVYFISRMYCKVHLFLTMLNRTRVCEEMKNVLYF